MLIHPDAIGDADITDILVFSLHTAASTIWNKN